MKQYKLTQKVLKIGDSAGVTLPAKVLKQAGIKPGDSVDIVLRPKTEDSTEVLAHYETFKKQYNQTLKNLANR